MIILFKYEGTLDVDLLQKITNFWVNENSILRSTYKINQNKLILSISDQLPIPISVIRVKEKKELLRQIKTITDKPINPEQKIAEITIFALHHEQIILFKWHHIAGDFFSANQLIMQLATALHTNKLPEIKKSEASYFDFIDWQLNYLSTQQAETHSSYWKNKILEFGSKELIKRDSSSGNGAIQFFQFPLHESNEIQLFCRKKSITPSQFFMAMYQAGLHQSGLQLPKFIMMPVNTRPGSNYRTTLGYFVNFIPIRCIPDRDMALDDLLQGVKADLLESLQNSYYPFNLILDDAVLYSHMMKVIYKFQSGLVSNCENASGLHKLARFGISEEITSLDDNLVLYPRGHLTLIISYENQQYLGAIHYHTSIYSSKDIASLTYYIKKTVTEIIVGNCKGSLS